MRHTGPIVAETRVGVTTFLRRRTAMMFTFLFPVILVVIFGVLVQSEPAGAGLFTEPAGYYVAGYLAVVILFTPLSRLSATVIRYRDGNQFEKLATTPLTRTDWLLAHTLVAVFIVIVASVLLVVVIATLTDAPFPRSPLVLPFIVAGVVLFAGVGACIGRFTKTEDGAIAVANTIALPTLFLGETFIPPSLFPASFQPAIDFIPLTYFSRGVRAVLTGGEGWALDLALLSVLAAIALVLGAFAIPRTD